MECREAVGHMAPYLDRELDPALAEAIARHLAECNACRTREGQAQSALRTIERTFANYRLSAPIGAASLSAIVLPREKNRGTGLGVSGWMAFFGGLGVGAVAGLQMVLVLMAGYSRRLAGSWEEFILLLWMGPPALALLLLVAMMAHSNRLKSSRRVPMASLFRRSGLLLFAFQGACTTLSILAILSQAPWGPSYFIPPDFLPSLLLSANAIGGASFALVGMYVLWLASRWLLDLRARVDEIHRALHDGHGGR